LTKKAPEDFCVHVLEADPTYVGGIARTAEHRGYRFDIGGHRFFSKSAEIEALWSEMLGEDLLERQRLSRIHYDGRFYSYPLKPFNVLGNLGLLRSARVLASYGRAKAQPISPERSFSDWVRNRFGSQLFTMFFESYTEKVWGIPCAELSADWAAQRIKGLSLRSAVQDMIFGKTTGPDGKVVKSLIEAFRYPRLGPGMMWEAARDRIEERGGHVHMDRRATSVILDGDRVASVVARGSDGSEEQFETDHLVCSAPMSVLVRAVVPEAPAAVVEAARSLRYRAFLTVVLITRVKDVFPDQWIYIHDPNLLVGRLQNYKNWSPEMVPDPDTTCLGLEYFCDAGDAFWSRTDEDLIALGTEELTRLGFVDAADIAFGTVVRMPRAYPVYDASYAQHVATIRSWVEQQATNLQLIGRAGMHRYNNQDHSMMTALLAARNILGGDYDPWQVNTDAEYHEEG
jgi:protoporphyrinogen oxidase